MREQLWSDDNSLKKEVATLNQQLNRQTALNRLQASQILDFEQSLW